MMYLSNSFRPPCALDLRLHFHVHFPVGSLNRYKTGRFAIIRIETAFIPTPFSGTPTLSATKLQLNDFNTFMLDEMTEIADSFATFIAHYPLTLQHITLTALILQHSNCNKMYCSSHRSKSSFQTTVCFKIKAS